MNCSKCGAHIKEGDRFCINCGGRIQNNEEASNFKELESKSWYRFTKVVYTFLYFFLFVILYFVFTESSQTYNYTSYGNYNYTYDYGNGLWVTFLTFLGGSAFLKLLKVSLFYVTTGTKPNWKIEIKKVLNPFF